MRSPGWWFPALIGGLFIAACSDGSGPGGEPPTDCTDENTQVLSAGQHVILDPLLSGACVRLPAAGGGGAEYLYLPVATEGQETEEGASAPYAIAGSSPAVAAVAPERRAALSMARQPGPAQVFHNRLRERERTLAPGPGDAFFNQGRLEGAATPPPVVGEQRTFDVCATTTCTSFVQTTATARVVGARVAVYVDDAAPLPGYTAPDLAHVADVFDNHLYPIDTTAFGRESDIDGNGVVVVLLTHRVNQLSPDCNSSQSVILGFFFGADLLPRGPSNPGSNEAEIFYGLVPDAGNPDCSISEEFALSHLPSTFVHEFQHMISFNQHRLVRGSNAEETWLNEGLSHFAEELAGRQVPDTECPVSGSCFSDFLAQGNVVNAFAYLQSPEDFFLIEPGNSTGQLEERGANWLFVRWLADHFAADPVLGTDLTRQLVMTSLVGAANVVAHTGVPFATLIPEWQATNFLDDLPGFSAPAARLRYKSWDFRAIAEANSLPYPLEPDSTSGVDYSHIGILRAGSGKHVRVVQPPGGAAVDLVLENAPVEPFPSEVDPRVALVRIR
ncbi:MAG TPA: hypothetical protein VF252_13755 [Gemmatimonadales bacterium]